MTNLGHHAVHGYDGSHPSEHQTHVHGDARTLTRQPEHSGLAFYGSAYLVIRDDRRVRALIRNVHRHIVSYALTIPKSRSPILPGGPAWLISPLVELPTTPIPAFTESSNCFRIAV